MENLGNLVNNYFRPKLLVTYGTFTTSGILDSKIPDSKGFFKYFIIISKYNC